MTCCYEPRPVPNQHFLPQDPSPPLSCAINHVAPFPAPPQVKGLPGEFSSGATQIKSNNGGEDTKDTQTKVTRVRPSPPIQELYFFLFFSLNITGAHYLLPGGILHVLIKKKNNLVVTFQVRSLLGCRWLLCFLGTKSDSPYLS